MTVGVFQKMFIESFVSLNQASGDGDFVSTVIQQLDECKTKVCRE